MSVKRLKVLLISALAPGETTTGQGLIFSSTLRELASDPTVDVSIALVIPNETRRTLSPQGIQSDAPFAAVPTWHFTRERLTKFSSIAAVGGFPCRRRERDFLAWLRENSESTDCAIWFGSAYDPLTRWLPKAASCPITFHVNDSITLFERNRKRRSKIKSVLARYHEERILTCGYANAIYVSADDFECACSIVGTAQKHLLPIGVDTQKFAPPVKFSEAKTCRLLFTGNMSYEPNVDAALYLIREIFTQLGSGFELVIAGADPDRRILEIANSNPRIKVTGRVSNIVEEYQKAAIFVAPMFTASGIKIKLLEAMACSLPVITTPHCASAFPQPAPHLILAGTRDEFRDRIVSLRSDVALRRQLGQESRRFAVQRFSWSNRTTSLMGIVREN